MAHKARAEARRLVPVATSALLNGDLERACSVLRDLQTATSIETSGATIANGVRSASGDRYVAASPGRR